MYFASRKLLRPPIMRAAYSDRTAWLLAEMSRLAYERFEPLESFDALAGKLANLSDVDSVKKELTDYLGKLSARSEPGLVTLKSALKVADFELVETFNSGGTQAFLAMRSVDRIAVLAFRGTEKNLADIETDLNARFYAHNGSRVHDGFRRAFELVRPEIAKAVAALPEGCSLYVTGHSLGGALALIATRELNSDRLAACYTFGSPKVGDTEFGSLIKPPIYRVVNAADAVPRVPPTWTIEVLILLSRFIPVPYLRAAVTWFLEKFRGYRHHGDMRYLSDCKDDCSDLRLIANPDQLDRIVWLVTRLSTNWKAGFLDHRIAQYCTKLEHYAASRLETMAAVQEAPVDEEEAIA